MRCIICCMPWCIRGYFVSQLSKADQSRRLLQQHVSQCLPQTPCSPRGAASVDRAVPRADARIRAKRGDGLPAGASRAQRPVALSSGQSERVAVRGSRAGIPRGLSALSMGDSVGGYARDLWRLLRTAWASAGHVGGAVGGGVAGPRAPDALARESILGDSYRRMRSARCGDPHC